MTLDYSCRRCFDEEGFQFLGVSRSRQNREVSKFGTGTGHKENTYLVYGILWYMISYRNESTNLPGSSPTLLARPPLCPSPCLSPLLRFSPRDPPRQPCLPPTAPEKEAKAHNTQSVSRKKMRFRPHAATGGHHLPATCTQRKTNNV